MTEMEETGHVIIIGAGKKSCHIVNRPAQLTTTAGFAGLAIAHGLKKVSIQKPF
jgi:hypothetical protein